MANILIQACRLEATPVCDRLDGHFTRGRKPWDLAAGALLVQEAGGVITDWEGGQGWFESGNLVAGTRGVARALPGCLKG